MHLADGQRADTREKTLYVVDENPLAFTEQMHDFVRGFYTKGAFSWWEIRGSMRRSTPEAFAQFQEAGTVTVQLDEIVRRRDLELPKVSAVGRSLP